MKFVPLRIKRSGASQSLTAPTVAPQQIHTYTELRRQIHDDLRLQHPEWVQPDGESPICDSYEARLMELLDNLSRSGSNESVAFPDRPIEHGLTQADTAAA